jgi:hypothetical protein
MHIDSDKKKKNVSITTKYKIIKLSYRLADQPIFNAIVVKKEYEYQQQKIHDAAKLL